jgi:hypothetical protein
MSEPLLRGEPATLTSASAHLPWRQARTARCFSRPPMPSLCRRRTVCSSITGADDIQETRVPIVAGRAGASLASNPVRTVELFREHVLPKL